MENAALLTSARTAGRRSSAAPMTVHDGGGRPPPPPFAESAVVPFPAPRARVRARRRADAARRAHARRRRLVRAALGRRRGRDERTRRHGGAASARSGSCTGVVPGASPRRGERRANRPSERAAPLARAAANRSEDEAASGRRRRPARRRSAVADPTERWRPRSRSRISTRGRREVGGVHRPRSAAAGNARSVKNVRGCDPAVAGRGGVVGGRARASATPRRLAQGPAVAAPRG